MTLPPDLIASIGELEKEGIQHLRNGNYPEAEKIFLQEYKMFLEWQDKNNRRIHKGGPLHNLGLSLLFQDKTEEGFKHILLAYIEDIISSGEKGAADNLPACIALRSLCGVVPADLRDLENSVLKKKIEGASFSNPEEIYKIAGPIVDDIWSNFMKLGNVYRLEVTGQKFLSAGNFEQAKQIYSEWYQTLIKHQNEIKARVHKGHQLHNIGIALFSQRNFQEAFKFFILAYAEDAISAYKIGDPDSLPAFKTLKDGFGIDLTLLKSMEALVFEKKKEKKEITNPYEIVSEFEARVSQEQSKLSESLQEIMKSKEQREKQLFSRFTKEEEALDNVFVILRRWNSATPRYPSISKQGEEGAKGSIGGGYYLRWRGKGIIIDPGYDFLALFFREQFGLNHIHAIIATHAHDDHTQDIETIFSLIHKMSKRLGQERRVDFYCSEGVKIKYSRLIEVSQTKATDLTQGVDLELANYDMRVKAVRTEHNEEPWMKNNTGVGLVLELKLPDNTNTFRLGITGDTKYWNGMETAFKDVDMLVAHLGTIGDPVSEHLQEEGCVRLIKAIRPKLVIVSEFGEELLGHRCKICDRMKTFINPLKQPGLEIPIIPGDVGLKIKLPSLEIYCENTGRYKECNKVVAVELSDGQVHYLDKDQFT